MLNREKEQSDGKPVLVLDVGLAETCFRDHNDQETGSVLTKTSNPRGLLETDVERSYWFSLDKENRRFCFGKGSMTERATVLEFDFPPVSGPRDRGSHCDPFDFVKNLRYIGLVNVPDGAKVRHIVRPVPVTIDLPPSLVTPDQLSLEDIARNRRTVVANLPEACRVLYANVSGASIALDTPDFPDFSTAINHSISTPGCICAEMLRKKANKFGRSLSDNMYLRITLGPNVGDSPGSPYVLEIWPAGHSSPIHDHGGACAVIKVLHGDIWVECFPELSGNAYPFLETQFHPGEITFLTPDLYQVHRLSNRQPAGNMTATIQCYRYPNEDTNHYEYFDYLDDQQKRRQFRPNSDWDYLVFKELIRQEWMNRSTPAPAGCGNEV